MGLYSVIVSTFFGEREEFNATFCLLERDTYGRMKLEQAQNKTVGHGAQSARSFMKEEKTTSTPSFCTVRATVENRFLHRRDIS